MQDRIGVSRRRVRGVVIIVGFLLLAGIGRADEDRWRPGRDKGIIGWLYTHLVQPLEDGVLHIPPG